MSTELNLSIGTSPQFFVRLDGWDDRQIGQLAQETRVVFGVLTVAQSAGSGMYVNFDQAVTSDVDVKATIRAKASEIVPGRIPPV